MAKVTYSEMIAAVEDGSYKGLPTERLRELLKGSLDISGSNPIALARIHHAAEELRAEVASRESEAKHKQTQRVAWIAVWVSVAGIAATALVFLAS
jgi:hypothetical protein